MCAVYDRVTYNTFGNLFISDMRRSDEGDYTCVASSAQGHAEAVARVKVTDESEYHVTAGSAKELIAVHGRVNYIN